MELLKLKLLEEIKKIGIENIDLNKTMENINKNINEKNTENTK